MRRRRDLLTILVALSLAAVGCSELVLDCEDPEGAGWDPDHASLEEAMVEAVNARREAGAVCRGATMPAVPPVEMDERLRCAARSHSLDMAAEDYFAHDSRAGNDVATRVDRTGYAWSVLSENLSGGYEVPEESVQSLMESTSGHCENIMDATVVDAGIGLAFASESTYIWYWTQVFASP